MLNLSGPLLRADTPIPTSLRGQIRARVKAHPGWKAFLDQKGILSASARNADLIEFALTHPALKAQIEQTLANYAAAAPAESAAVLMLATRVEKLLAAYAARKLAPASAKPPQEAKQPRIRIKAVSQAL